MKRFVILIFLSVFSGFVFGQFFSSGPDPASVKWKQINTPNFQLIYPEDFSSEAFRLASMMEYVYEHVSADYRKKPKKISILLHTHSVVSNAYVSWAPRRSEWVTTPPAEAQAIDWLQKLAIHEFRHVVQVSNLDQGFTRICKLLFGEAAVGLTVGYLPLWYLEGDAVQAETVFSSSGRGRESEFDRELRAIESDEGKRLSYDQAFLGSYKHYTPDHYSYGYQMVSYGRLKYGMNIWDQVLHQIARTPLLLVPFYKGLKQGGIRSKNDLYNETFDSLKTLWNNSLNNVTLNYTSNIPIEEGKDYRNYIHLRAQQEGYLAVRQGMDDISRIILLKDNAELSLVGLGLYPGTRISTGKRYICWAEYRLDPRWDRQSFYVLHIYDQKTGKTKLLGKKKRWFSPELSLDETRILCLQVDHQNEYSLVILDIDSEEILQEIPLPGILKAETPVWIDEEHLSLIATDSKGEYILQINLRDTSSQVLFQGGRINLGYLSSAGDDLLFTYDIEQARNIYIYRAQDKTVYRLTRSKFGADFPAYDSQQEALLFSDYTPKGYRMHSVPMDSLQPEEISGIENYVYPWAEHLSARAQINIEEDSIPQASWQEKPYRKFGHLFNFHSWAPFYVDPYQVSDFTTALKPGLTLMSQNKLSTLTGLFSYYYSNEAHHLESRLIYEGLYPVIEVNMNYASTAGYHSWPKDSLVPEAPESDKRISLQSYLPLSYTRHAWNLYIKPLLGFSYFHRYYYKREGPQLGYSSVEGSLTLFHYRKQSYRDLQPRLGQYLFLRYYKPLISREFFARGFAGSYQVYLPGLFNHHGIRLGMYYEYLDPEKYPMYRNMINLPRGFDEPSLFNENIKAILEYKFPLCYPDWSLGPLLYVKRLHLSLHADVARIKYWDFATSNELQIADLLSVGMILGGDIHFFRFFMPFEPSLRISWLPSTERLDIGFSMNLNTSVY